MTTTNTTHSTPAAPTTAVFPTVEPYLISSAAFISDKTVRSGQVDETWFVDLKDLLLVVTVNQVAARALFQKYFTSAVLDSTMAKAGVDKSSWRKVLWQIGGAQAEERNVISLPLALSVLRSAGGDELTFKVASVLEEKTGAAPTPTLRAVRKLGDVVDLILRKIEAIEQVIPASALPEAARRQEAESELERMKLEAEKARLEHEENVLRRSRAVELAQLAWEEKNPAAAFVVRFEATQKRLIESTTDDETVKRLRVALATAVEQP